MFGFFCVLTTGSILDDLTLSTVLGPGIALEDDAGDGNTAAGDNEKPNGIGGGAALDELDFPCCSASIL